MANLLCRPSETLQRRRDSFIYYSRAFTTTLLPAVHRRLVRVLGDRPVMCACVRLRLTRGQDGGVAREFSAALARGAGPGHVNILINMRESITEEARA